MATASMTTMTNEHPDFTNAPESQRWTGSLDALFYTLTKAAYEGRGGWVRRVLPHGAKVAMRVKLDSFPRKELVIGRSTAPSGEQAEAAWARELDTFLKYAKVSPQGGWLPTKDDRAGGAVRQCYVELYPLEVAPDKVRCAEPGCNAVLDFTLSDKPLRCEECQRKADVAELQVALDRRVGARRADERAPYGGKA